MLVGDTPSPEKKAAKRSIKSANAEIEIKETSQWIPKRKGVADHASRSFFENSGMSYEEAINYALDKEVQNELDDTLAHKSECELTDDERKYLKRKKEKKSYTLNVRFTKSEMQDILAKCEQYGYKNKTEYIRAA